MNDAPAASSAKANETKPEDGRPAAPASRTSAGPQRSKAAAEAILDAAQAVLAEAGYAGFTIERVAKRAGAGKPTIYRWWNGKAALLLEVYARQKLDLVDVDTGTLEGDLVALIRGVCRLWRETPAGDIFRSIIAEAQSDPAAFAALRSFLAERRYHAASVFERARARGELDPAFDRDVTLDLVSGLLWNWLLTRRLDDDDALFAATARQIAQGALRR